MHRKVARLPKELQDTANWPQPPDAVIAMCREVYGRRRRAIEAYVQGDSLKSIERDEHIDSGTLYELFDACTRPSQDGEIPGFCAIVPYARHKKYERKGEIKSDVIAAGRGTAGLFYKLLTDYASLRNLLDSQAKKYSSEEWRARRIPVAQEHEKFLRALAKEVGEQGYPFSVSNKGREGYRIALHAAINRRRSKMASSIHDSLWRQFLPQTAEIFRRVQIDAHRLDKPIPVKFIGRKGRFRVRMLRPWLLVAHECDSLAVLGWHLSVEQEPSELDVLRCLYSMMNPWEPRSAFEIDGLGYLTDEGMPSGLIPHCRCRYADAYYLDNALAHHANNLRAVILTKLHGSLHLGKPGEPRTRSEIEQLFNTLTHRHIQPMVGGLRPDMSNRERRAAFKAAEREGMTIEQIEEYLDVVLCRYNAHPNSAHYGKSPLQYLAEEPDWALLRADDSERASWRDLLTIELSVPVRSSPGHPPHINYQGASYTNDLLQCAVDLVSRDIIITVNLMDLRKVEAHLSGGTALGSLMVIGEWQHFLHDYRLRVKLNQAINDGRFHWIPAVSPEQAVAEFMGRARKTKAPGTSAERQSSRQSRGDVPVNSRTLADVAISMELDLDAVLGDKLEG